MAESSLAAKAPLMVRSTDTRIRARLANIKITMLLPARCHCESQIPDFSEIPEFPVDPLIR